VLASGRHLLRLINDVLDLSKIEAGRMDLVPEPFEVLPAVQEVRSIASSVANGKDIKVHCHVAHAAARVTLDRHRFMQILYNLLSNALKFTDSGGEVNLELDRRGDALQIQVRDTGIGIRAEDLAKLFVEFQQLDSGATRRHQGTGLGLVLTRRIAELHGGSVRVASTPGMGSTFTVLLPFAAGREGN
jgi:signal transduction histidine kinase